MREDRGNLPLWKRCTIVFTVGEQSVNRTNALTMRADCCSAGLLLLKATRCLRSNALSFLWRQCSYKLLISDHRHFPLHLYLLRILTLKKLQCLLRSDDMYRRDSVLMCHSIDLVTLLNDLGMKCCQYELRWMLLVFHLISTASFTHKLP